jgi:hypothetical protein
MPQTKGGEVQIPELILGCRRSLATFLSLRNALRGQTLGELLLFLLCCSSEDGSIQRSCECEETESGKAVRYASSSRDEA